MSKGKTGSAELVAHMLRIAPIFRIKQKNRSTSSKSQWLRAADTAMAGRASSSLAAYSPSTAVWTAGHRCLLDVRQACRPHEPKRAGGCLGSEQQLGRVWAANRGDEPSGVALREYLGRAPVPSFDSRGPVTQEHIAASRSTALWIRSKSSSTLTLLPLLVLQFSLYLSCEGSPGLLEGILPTGGLFEATAATSVENCEREHSLHILSQSENIKEVEASIDSRRPSA